MTPIDISPEAVERTINDLWERANATEARQAELMIRALSAALTLHQNDANYQCRERVKEWERANAAELALTQSRAETAAAILQMPRFPNHMSKVMAAKTADLPSRIADLVESIKSIPDEMKQYQWQADPKQSFGSKWVRCVAGDNGRGVGRQAIAEVVSHIGVADYIAAANPDTVSMLIAENADLHAKLADAILAAIKKEPRP